MIDGKTNVNSVGGVCVFVSKKSNGQNILLDTFAIHCFDFMIEHRQIYRCLIAGSRQQMVNLNDIIM